MDIFIGGHRTMVGDLKPEGIFDPLDPTSILPEAKEGKNWPGDEFFFVDKDV